MQKPIQILKEILDLKKVNETVCIGQSYNPGWDRVYGGQVISQSIMAACKTVPENECHSMHGYFLRPGDPNQHIKFKIDPVRNGRSFQTRVVYAIQNEEVIFTMTASFQKKEVSIDHQDQMGDVPKPDDFPPIKDLMHEYKDRLPHQIFTYFTKDRPFEMRPLDIDRYVTPKPEKPEHSFWLKTNGSLGGNPALNKAALGYASDFTLLDTALIAHGKLLFEPDIMCASLDHAMWFHRPFRVDEWLLYRQTSSNAFGARALCHGQFFNQQGQLVASATQEGLTRIIKP